MKESRKIKVMHFVSGLVSGGVEEMLYNYCKFLDHKKYEFIVVYQHKPVTSCIEKIQSAGCKTVRITARSENFIKNIKDSIVLIKKEKPDIVHAHMNLMKFCALYAAKKSGVPVRISHSHIAEKNKGIVFRTMASICKRLCIRTATALFTCGEEAGEYLYSSRLMKSGKVALIKNAVDLDYFKITDDIRLENRKELELMDDFVVGHVGRFTQQKNHERLLKIFKSLTKYKENAKLLLVGTGELEEHIRTKSKELGIDNKVVFYGTTNAISKVYSVMDMFVLPSLYEGFPVVSIEIQAANIPALFSDTIAETCKITDAIQFYDLSKSNDEWARKVIETYEKFEPCDLTKLKKLYDIRSKASYLDKCYDKLLAGDSLNEKIAVLNCSHIMNYGSVLQSYATEKIIRDITGQQVYSIRYRQKKDFTYFKNYLPLLFNKDIVSFKMKGVKRKLYLKFIDKALGVKCNNREKYFKKFNAAHFNYSDVYQGRNELERAAVQFDYVVLGSDQVWHPINYGSHYYTMEWVPDNIPKITYAASFGVSSIPKNQWKGTAKYLKRIESITVREQKGAEIVKELTGRDVPVVVDPTLLLDAKEWNNVCLPIDEKDEYIFCYFLGNNASAREYAKKIKKKTGLKILCIPFMDEINKIDFNFGDKQLFDVGPGEFLSYIKNARYVITDSFHGTVFSIIFHKQFVVFNRFNNSEQGATNSRIDTLLMHTGLSGRRYSTINKDVLDKDVQFDVIDEMIEKLKKESISELCEFLEIEG